MQTLKFNIPLSKVPALATAAILEGSDLGSWLADSVDRSQLAAPKQAPVAGSAYDAPCLLPTSMPETELSPADEDPTLNELFADCL